jgi:hypothetical protein
MARPCRAARRQRSGDADRTAPMRAADRRVAMNLIKPPGIGSERLQPANAAATLMMRGSGRLGLLGLGEAFRHMLYPVPRQHLGLDDLFGTVALPDLLGAALFRSFAKFGSNGVRVDQFLGKGGCGENE